MLVWSGLYLLVMALTRLSAAQARVLCLHYYSNALGFNFEDQEEVYREEKIKEWEPVDPADIEVFLQLCLVRLQSSALMFLNQSLDLLCKVNSFRSRNPVENEVDVENV